MMKHPYPDSSSADGGYRPHAEMKMLYAGSLDEALEMARGIVGQDAKVTVIPNGILVIVSK